jgi:hypothetical protein
VCDDDDNITFANVDALLNDPVHDDDSDFYLPPHQRCAAYTLNLAATHDLGTANADAVYKKTLSFNDGKNVVPCGTKPHAVHSLQIL